MVQSESIIKCFCIWSDLLGFGQAFEDGKWSFSDEATKKNIERLKRLEHSIHSSNAPEKEVAFILNDGLARVYDLPKPVLEASAFLWWFHTTLSNHWMVNSVDIQNNHPGMRSVLSFGERLSSWKGNKTYGDHFYGDSKYKREADKKICIYSPEEFQLNLAFSKAYIIESGGSKAGLVGPAIFVDIVVLDEIEKYLTNGFHDYLYPTGSTMIDKNHGELHYEEIKVSYVVHRKNIGNVFEFEIYRILKKQKIQILSIEFDSCSINFSKRGLNTKLFKVLKYNPIDEQKPFYFDFDNYGFKNNDV